MFASVFMFVLSFLLCSSVKLSLILVLSLSMAHVLWGYPVFSSKVSIFLLVLMARSVIGVVEYPNSKESREICGKNNVFLF